MSTRKQIAATLAAAAFTGMLAGTTQAATPASAAPSVAKAAAAQTESILGKQLAVEATTAPAAKHACKGKNDCKGAGGCGSGDAGCKGKNTCKGKGGCSTETPTTAKIA